MTHESSTHTIPPAKGDETVAAVVVTYNRKGLLCQCIGALLGQTRPLDAIYIIDNASTDGTDDTVSAQYGDRVIYERLPRNTGGAGGFHRGLKRAFEERHGWIWVMDDDAQPTAQCLESLLKHAVTGVGFVAPLICDRTGHPQSYHHKVSSKSTYSIWTSWSPAIVTDQLTPDYRIPIDANAFVGPLINRDAIEAIGLPRSDYFILFDDHEYTYRVSRRFPSYLVPGATIFHFDVNNERTAKPYQTQWKTYYHFRNWIDFTKHNDGLLAAILLTGKIIIGTTMKVGCGWYRNPIYSYRSYCLGAWHGLIGQLHNDWGPT